MFVLSFFYYSNESKLNHDQKLPNYKHLAHLNNRNINFFKILRPIQKMRKSFVLTHLKGKTLQKDNSKQPRRNPSGIKSGLALQEPVTNSKKSVTHEIDALIARIDDTNNGIKQTQKLLDIDLFLKTQKQKRLQYARQLDTQFEVDKKKREDKLYKKHNREERAVASDLKEKGGKKKVSIPLDIMKIFQFNPQKISQDGAIRTILNGHHYNFNSGNELEQIIEGLTPEQIIRYENLIKDQENQYKQIIKMASNSLEAKIFTPSILVQESQLIPLPECQNLMNALAFLVTNQEFAQNHYLEYKRSNKQFILCRFYDYGVRRSILTTPTLQVRQFTHKLVNVGSRMHSNNIFWPGIIQKCYRMLKFPYGITKKNIQKLTLLETIYDVYGLDAEIIPFSNKSLIMENFPKIMYSLLMDNALVGFMNATNPQNSVYRNRVYPLIAVENKTVKKKQSEFHYRLHDLWRGKVLSSQNTNYFRVLELCEMFDTIVVVKNYPQKWKQLRIKVSFFSMGAISSLNNEWTKNSQYLFTITKQMSMRIVLRKIRDSLQTITKPLNQEDDGCFGFLLFKNSEYLTHITCMKVDNLVQKSKSTDLNGASYLCQLQKGNYILVPYSNNPSTKEYKFFYLDFFVQKEEGINFGKAKITDYSFSNQQSEDKSGNVKVIQQMMTTDKFQKPKIQILNFPTVYSTKKDFQQDSKKDKQSDRNSNQSKVQHPKVNLKYLESLGIVLFKGVKLEEFYIPGSINSLLINKEATAVERKPKPSKKGVAKPEHKVNPELAQCEREQNLKVLVGYDVMSEDINRGKMKQFMSDCEDQIDLADYELGQQGIIAIMEALMDQPRILKINLRNNLLTDQAITYLCYYLEKGNRRQLSQLDISRNPAIGTMGINALNGLKARLQKLQIIGMPGQKRKKAV